MYLVVGLDSNIAWPTERVALRYRGFAVWLRPGTDELSPSIVVPYEPPLTAHDALLIARRFLSSLCWADGHYIREVMVLSATVPMGAGRPMNGQILAPKFRADYLPEPSDPKAQLALALYREALGVNSVPYQFLGFCKIINILYEASKAQRDWINATLPHIVRLTPCIEFKNSNRHMWT